MERQKTPYGCGMYAIANAFNMPDFITEKRLQESKSGNRLGQLTKWVQEDGNDFYLEVLYYDHNGLKLPESATKYKPIGEEILSFPVLIEVRYSEEGKNHMIGGKIFDDGTLYLYDSLKEEMTMTTLSGVNELYHNVYGLFCMCDMVTGEWIFLCK